MNDNQIADLLDNILSENRLYNPKDPVARTAFIQDDEKVANALAFNFFGTLALFMSTDHLGERRWKQYMKKDKRLQLFAINSYNNDTSLVVKLASDKGWFLSDAFTNNLTKFLFKLKSGGIDAADIKIDLIGDLIKGVKPEAYTAMAGNIRTALQEFRRDLNPYEFAAKLETLATQYKESGDFFALSKRCALVDNSSRYGSKVSPTGASGTTATTSQPSTQTTSTPVVTPVPVAGKSKSDDKSSVITKKKDDDQTTPSQQQPSAPAPDPVPPKPKTVSVDVAVPKIPPKRDPNAFVEPKQQRTGDNVPDMYYPDERTLPQILNHPGIPSLVKDIINGKYINKEAMFQAVTSLLFPAWSVEGSKAAIRDEIVKAGGADAMMEKTFEYTKEYAAPSVVMAAAGFFMPTMMPSIDYGLKRAVAKAMLDAAKGENKDLALGLIWKLIGSSQPQDWGENLNASEMGLFCQTFNIRRFNSTENAFRIAYEDTFSVGSADNNKAAPSRIFKFSPADLNRYWEWVKPITMLSTPTTFSTVASHSMYNTDGVSFYEGGRVRNTNVTRALSELGKTLGKYFPVTDFITDLEAKVEGEVIRIVSKYGAAANVKEHADRSLREFILSTRPADNSLSDIKLRAATIRGFWKGLRSYFEDLLTLDPEIAAERVDKITKVKSGSFLNANSEVNALGEVGIGSGGTLTTVSKSEYSAEVSKFWLTFEKYRNYVRAVHTDRDYKTGKESIERFVKLLLMSFSGMGVENNVGISHDIRNGQFDAVANAFKEDLFQYMLMESYASSYGQSYHHSVGQVKVKAFAQNPKLLGEFRDHIREKIANRDLDYFKTMFEGDLGYYGYYDMQNVKKAMEEYIPGITDPKYFPIDETAIVSQLLGDTIQVVDAATEMNDNETMEKVYKITDDILEWGFDSFTPQWKVNGKYRYFETSIADDVKDYLGGVDPYSISRDDLTLTRTKINASGNFFINCRRIIGNCSDKWSYRQKGINPRRAVGKKIYAKVLEVCDAGAIKAAIPDITNLFRSGVMEDMDSDATRITLEALAEGRFNEIFGPEQIKKIYRRADKKAVQTMLFELIIDNVEEHPDLVEQVYEGLTPYYQQQVRKNLLNVNMLKDALMNSPIPPFTDLSLKQIKGMLRVNDIDADTLLQELKIRKKKNEKITDFVIRAKKEYEAKGVGIIPPFVEEGDNSPNHLKNVTHRMIQNHHRGKHGYPRKIYPILKKEFTVTMDSSQYEAFVAEMKESGDHRTFEPCFHGTGGIAASMILRFGFREIRFGDDVIGTAGKSLGEGIYLAAHIDKAALYCSNNGYNNGGGNKGYLFFIEPELGRANEHTREAATGTIHADPRFRNWISPEWCAKYPPKQLKILKAYECEPMYKEDYYRFVSDMIPEGADGSPNYSMKALREFKNQLNEDIMNGDETDELEKRADSVFIFYDGSFPIPVINPDTGMLTYDIIDITHVTGAQEVDSEDEEADWDQLPEEQKKYFSGTEFKPNLPPGINFEVSAVGVEVTISDTPSLEIVPVDSSYRLDSDAMQLYTTLWVERMQQQADKNNADPSTPEEDGIATTD